MTRIENLVELIKHHSYMYYNNEPEISDDEFDHLVDELKKLDPNNDIFKKVGVPVPFDRKWKKVKHGNCMGSLNKCLLEDVDTFMQKYKDANQSDQPTEFVLTPKFDGISIELYYENEELKSAVTRGDGEMGEDIFENVLKMKNVPKNLNLGICLTGYFRGEIVMLKEDFKKVNELSEKKFSNPRNAASGIARGYDGKFCEYLTVMWYDGYDSGAKKDMLACINRIVFEQTPFHIVKSNFELYDLYNAYKAHRDSYPYQIDGLVLEVSNKDLRWHFSYTGNRPDHAVAIKFPAMEKITKLLDVEWNTTRTGRVNPRARLEPIELDGSVVQYATLHNIDYIDKLGLRIGDMVVIKKAGDIIPAIVKIHETNTSEDLIIAPTICPDCKTELKLKGAYLICNNSNCSSKQFAKLVHYCKVLEMDYVSSGILEKLYDAELVRTPWDLYQITKDQLLVMEGVGEKITDNFLNELKTKSNMTAHKFLVALSMDGLADKNAEILANDIERRWVSIECFVRGGAILTDREWLQWFTELTAAKIVKSLVDNITLITRLLDVVTIVKKENVSNKLEGKSFCITGSLEDGSRDEYIKLIKSNGGEYKGGVSKGLTYLVTNDTESGSSKNKKAKELGIGIINENQLKEMMI